MDAAAPIVIQLSAMDRLIPSLYTRLLFFFEKNLDEMVGSCYSSLGLLLYLCE